MRVVVAMSGGVDSSVAAALLVEAGHEVIGIAMKTHALEPRANRACCTPDDMRDARRVADLLNIPFYVLNYAELFEEAVIKPFAQAYAEGHTPNPCIECNEKVKFGPLLERARLLGAAFLATGHYARLEDRDGVRRLKRAVDRGKDQSYFLYRLQQAQLQALMFPLGDLYKDDVRQQARRLRLPVAEKAESQEICFVGTAGYTAVVEKVTGADGVDGNIVDRSGRILGRHRGVHHFTLGQRRGLGVAAPTPRYVTHLDAATQTVTVGDKGDLLVPHVDLSRVVWTHRPPNENESVFVQQRYREQPRAAYISVGTAGCTRLKFHRPEACGAPGQAAVIFQDDVVLGGGSIVAVPTTRGSLPIIDAGVA